MRSVSDLCGEPVRAALIVALWIPSVALADSGVPLTENARAAALAGAVTALDNDLSAIAANPAALASLEHAAFSLSARGGLVDFDFRRTGERTQTFDRSLVGFGLSLASPLPGKADFLVFGASLNLPAQNILRFRASPRADAPRLALYESRVERTAITLALGAKFFERIQVGYGVTLAPNLTLPTAIDFDAEREGETNNDRVAVNLDLTLRTGVAWNVGMRLELHDRLAIGLRYSEAIVLKVSGPTDIRAGGIRLDEVLDFEDVASPQEIALGLTTRPVDGLMMSVDVRWADWSSYRTILSRDPDPGWSDVWNVRVGGEARVARGLDVRLGYGWLPSPVPAQRGNDNLLDGDRHEVALGLGVDLDAWDLARVRLDVYGRVHAFHQQRAVKDTSLLRDADPATPDRQIDNQGFPGFSSRGGFWQLGVTATASLGREANR